jgi:hypothetical protein
VSGHGKKVATAAGSPGRPFFIKGRGEGTWYEFAQRPRNRYVLDYCEGLWTRWESYCANPDHFLSEAARDFEARTWEMRVACAMMDAGHTLARPAQDAPDVLVTAPTRVWVEATAAQEGSGPDAARRVFSLRRKTKHGEIGLYTISHDNIVMRITGALATKAASHSEYVKRGHVKPGEPFVVAISGGMIHESSEELDGLPLAVRTVYGNGDFVMIVPIGEGKPYVEWRPKPTISKRNGSPVSTRAFLDGVMPHVSAMLFTSMATPNAPLQAATHHGEHWRDLILIHNPTATAPIPRGWIPVGREYWIEGNRIRCEDRRREGQISEDDVDDEVKALVQATVKQRRRRARQALGTKSRS